jgi:acylphosphatase
MERIDMIITGVVQGVGFRYSVVRKAAKYGVAGTVKNMDDGTVRIACEGESDNMEPFVRDVQNVREPVVISDVKIERSDNLEGFKCFTAVPGRLENEVMEGFSTGGMYFEKVLGKQDQMLDKQDQMLGKQDQMLDKQDQTIGEIKTLSSNLQELIDMRFKNIERDILQIKQKIGL